METSFGENKNTEAQKNELQEREVNNDRFSEGPILVKMKEATAASPGLNQNPGKVKQINVIMLDSESVISPAVSEKEPREKPSAAPNFTNSYNDNRKSWRPSPTIRPLFIGAILLLLGSAILGAYLFNRHPQPSASQQTTTDVSQVPTSSQSSSDINNDTATAQNGVSKKEKSAPAVIENPSSAESKYTALNQSSGEKQTENKVAKQNEPIKDQSAREKPMPTEVERVNNRTQSRDTAAGENVQTELNASLNDLVSATKAGDVEQQMNHYAPKMNSYYRSRNAPQEAVRNERKQVFEGADAVDIQTSKPNITLSPDGRTATMRFRKKYAIKKGQSNRNGEVVQEMKWVKSSSGWKIVSERDLKVIH